MNDIASPSTAPICTPEDAEKNKVFGVLAYLGILWLVPLLAAKDSPFAKYHANEGLILFIMAVGCAICLPFVSMALVFIPVLGVLLMGLIHFAFIGSIFALVICGIINAANGTCKPLPIIGGRFKLLK